MALADGKEFREVLKIFFKLWVMDGIVKHAQLKSIGESMISYILCFLLESNVKVRYFNNDVRKKFPFYVAILNISEISIIMKYFL